MNRRELLKRAIAASVVAALPAISLVPELISPALDLKNNKYGNYVIYTDEADATFVLDELIKNLSLALPPGTPYNIIKSPAGYYPSDPYAELLTMGWKAGLGVDGPYTA